MFMIFIFGLTSVPPNLKPRTSTGASFITIINELPMNWMSTYCVTPAISKRSISLQLKADRSYYNDSILILGESRKL